MKSIFAQKMEFSYALRFPLKFSGNLFRHKKFTFAGNKLHAFLENASRWMKTRHKYGRMKAHGMRPAFYAATSARNKLVFALPLNHKLSMP